MLLCDFRDGARAACLALVLAPLAACFSPQYGEDPFICEVYPDCPRGYECIGGICRKQGTGIDAAADVGMPDGPLHDGPLLDSPIHDGPLLDQGPQVPGKWIAITKGSFDMGSPIGEACRDPLNEKLHTVTLNNDYEISETEVTQGQFSQWMPTHQSKNAGCTTCPVELVTWHEAASYCNWLSSFKKLDECYKCSAIGVTNCQPNPPYDKQALYQCPGYRLPTEAEWEYAYRAGTTTAYYNGTNDPATCSSCSVLDTNAGQIAWYCYNAGTTPTTHPVKQKDPNAWGLYDMAGNVAEWVHDWFGGSDELMTLPFTNPIGASNGPNRVVRGGDYGNHPERLRGAFRYGADPSKATERKGFRCARTLTP